MRIGVFGPGWWSRKYLVPALRSAPDASVVALCGRDAARTRAAADSVGVGGAYTSVTEMLDRERLDALVVASPPSSHLAAVQAAASRGVHVFCEKPLARSAAESAEMVSASSGVRTVVGFTQRWHPGVRTAYELIGEIGPVRHLRYLSASVLAADASSEWNWRYSADEYAYGILSDLGPHAVDMVRWLVGEVEAVDASACTVFSERPAGDGVPRAVENWDDCVVTARVAGGVQASLVLTRVLPVSPYRRFHHQLEVVGEAGSLTYTSDRPAEVVVAVGGKPRVVKAEGVDVGTAAPGSFEEMMAVQGVASARQAADMLDVFAGKPVPHAPTMADGHATQLVLDAAAQVASKDNGTST